METKQITPADLKNLTKDKAYMFNNELFNIAGVEVTIVRRKHKENDNHTYFDYKLADGVQRTANITDLQKAIVKEGESKGITIVFPKNNKKPNNVVDKILTNEEITAKVLSLTKELHAQMLHFFADTNLEFIKKFEEEAGEQFTKDITDKNNALISQEKIKENSVTLFELVQMYQSGKITPEEFAEKTAAAMGQK